MEDGFCLAAVTGLFAVVTAFSLGEEGGLAGFVLGDFVLGVLFAVFAFAVGAAGFGYVHLWGRYDVSQSASFSLLACTTAGLGSLSEDVSWVLSNPEVGRLCMLLLVDYLVVTMQ